jgi:anaerobic magnesium-protoporphyrin IX monomethyl ester cyclase
MPVPRVIEQIRYLKEKFKIKQFHFYDDTISCKRDYIVELCQRMLDEKLDLHWSCFARVDTVDEEVLRIMKRAGCFIIMYGVESMDENILKSFNKGITIPEIRSALENTRKSGIESRVSLIIGSPDDTYLTMEKTRKEVLKLKTDFLQVFIAIPMPGSQFYLDALAETGFSVITGMISIFQRSSTAIQCFPKENYLNFKGSSIFLSTCALGLS